MNSLRHRKIHIPTCTNFPSGSTERRSPSQTNERRTASVKSGREREPRTRMIPRLGGKSGSVPKIIFRLQLASLPPRPDMPAWSRRLPTCSEWLTLSCPRSLGKVSLLVAYAVHHPLLEVAHSKLGCYFVPRVWRTLPCSPPLCNLTGSSASPSLAGSGSACRSVYGGFVRWTMGARDDGADSVASQVAPADHWPEIQILILVVNAGKKGVSSTSGMQTSCKTSALIGERAKTVVPARMKAMEEAIHARDFEAFGKLTMQVRTCC